jgi:hypothetical protein
MPFVVFMALVVLEFEVLVVVLYLLAQYWL